MCKYTCNTSDAYHLQHAVCHMGRRDSSAVEFERFDVSFISFADIQIITDYGLFENRSVPDLSGWAVDRFLSPL